MSQNLASLVGKHIYTSKERNDPASSLPLKRHNNIPPKTQRVTVRGKILEVRELEFKIQLCGNNNNEFDGETIVVDEANCILVPGSMDIRTDEDHGPLEEFGHWQNV